MDPRPARNEKSRNRISDVFRSAGSILQGLRIPLRYFFTRPVVTQYPEQRIMLSPRYRGIHEFEANKCIACDLCAKACPVDCIYIDKTAPRRIDKRTGIIDAADPTNGALLRFAIDYSKCLFCALCTEPCPTSCIHMGKLHDLSGYSREDVVVEFTKLDAVNRRTPLPVWAGKGDAVPWIGELSERIKAGRLSPNDGDIGKTT